MSPDKLMDLSKKWFLENPGCKKKYSQSKALWTLQI